MKYHYLAIIIIVIILIIFAHSNLISLDGEFNRIVPKALDGEVLAAVQHDVPRTGVYWAIRIHPLSLRVNLHRRLWVTNGHSFKFCEKQQLCDLII